MHQKTIQNLISVVLADFNITLRQIWHYFFFDNVLPRISRITKYFFTKKN